MASGRLQDLGRLARGLGLVAAQGLGELAGTQAARKALAGDFGGALIAATKEGAEVVASLPGKTHTFSRDVNRHRTAGDGAGSRSPDGGVVSSVDNTVASAVGAGLENARSAASQAGLDSYMQQAEQTVKATLDTVAGSLHGASQQAEQSVKSTLDSLRGQRPPSELGGLVTGTGSSLQFTATQEAAGERLTEAGQQVGKALGQALDPLNDFGLEARVGDAFRQLEGAIPQEQRAQLSGAIDGVSLASRIASHAGSHPDSQLRRVLNGQGFNLQAATQEVTDVLKQARAQNGGGFSPELRQGVEQAVQFSKQVDQQLGLRGVLERAGNSILEALFEADSGAGKLRQASSVSSAQTQPGFGADIWSWIENKSNSSTGTNSRLGPSSHVGAGSHQSPSAGVQPLAAGTHSPEERLAKLKAMPVSEHSQRMPSETNTGTVTFVAPGHEAKLGKQKGDLLESRGMERPSSGRDMHAAGAALGIDAKRLDDPGRATNGEDANTNIPHAGRSPLNSPNDARSASAAGRGAFDVGTGGVDATRAAMEGSTSTGTTSVGEKLKDGNAAEIDEPVVAQSKEVRARRRAEESKRKEVERRTKQARERKVPAGPMARVFG